MEKKNDSANSNKITTTERQIKSGAPKPEDKQRSSTIAMYAIQSVDDKESSHFVRKFPIRLLKQTAKTVGSLRMASEFSAEEVTGDDDNQEENGKGESAVATANNRRPVATARPKFAIDKIATGDSGEVDLKASNAEEFTNQANELNEGHSRTFGGQISKARRPDLLPLPLRPDSYSRPASIVTPDDVRNATDTVVPDRVVNPFKLPVRFRKRIQASASGSDVGPPMSVFDDVYLEDREEEAETRRHEDMEMALAWIQHEQRQIKEDDRRLARQLLDLRASVHQLRGLTDCQSFNSDEEGDLDLDSVWSPNNSRSTRSLDSCVASSSVVVVVDGGSGGCFASTPAISANRRRRRSELDEVPSGLIGSYSNLSSARRFLREEVYV